MRECLGKHSVHLSCQFGKNCSYALGMNTPPLLLLLLLLLLLKEVGNARVEESD